MFQAAVVFAAALVVMSEVVPDVAVTGVRLARLVCLAPHPRLLPIILRYQPLQLGCVLGFATLHIVVLLAQALWIRVLLALYLQ